jgi:hypothetical protein
MEFREFASIFVSLNGIPSCFFFRRRVRKGNSESLLLFLFHRTEFQVAFSTVKGFGREFQEFASIFIPRNGIPRKGSERNSKSFLFRGTTGITL